MDSSASATVPKQHFCPAFWGLNCCARRPCFSSMRRNLPPCPPGVPRRLGGTRHASSGLIPPPKLPLPLVPPGTVLPGAWGASEAGEDVLAEPLRGAWTARRCPRWATVPYHIEGGVCSYSGRARLCLEPI